MLRVDLFSLRVDFFSLACHHRVLQDTTEKEPPGNKKNTPKKNHNRFSGILNLFFLRRILQQRARAAATCISTLALRCHLQSPLTSSVRPSSSTYSRNIRLFASGQGPDASPHTPSSCPNPQYNTSSSSSINMGTSAADASTGVESKSPILFRHPSPPRKGQYNHRTSFASSFVLHPSLRVCTHLIPTS